MQTFPSRSSTSAELLAPLSALLADYWHDVDHHWGRHAHLLYRDDGVFAIGDDLMNGPDAIRAFYSWRESRGARAARHVVSNIRVVPQGGDTAQLDAIMCLYAADGVPVLESKPPILIADVSAQCVRGDDGLWRFASHLLKPVFAGGVPITTPSGQKS